ncbi:hypothetical protein [Pseudomonas aeruginosa]|nr:hypothetical protein [Pseudomonas aeruginosa]MCO1763872.1 hypothetical protein [Pseudomonas aeruginosa]MCS7938898.1 hypothetical protein [Pseudomonas aeruginosa]MCV4037226.1 hypothetical protein [Pseudomonas aeruginosa]QYE69898.1 hypothetical protein KZ798_18420 [Pseudomonas aeruginosa]HEJ3685337.1 hypothetical protein [Pseudomonas aeruginosa]
MGDFIWKSPSIIKTEIGNELAKIDSYFPAGVDEATDMLRAARFSSSQRRISEVYPYMQATGNFFAVLSAFEAYLLLLSKEVSILFGCDFNAAKGMGLEKINNHFRNVGVDLNKAELYTAVSSAYSIRNCIVHCAGILSMSRDAGKIRNIVSKYQHFGDVALKNARNGMEDVVNSVRIVEGDLGERLLISNNYAHMVCGYLVKYFLSVSELVVDLAYKQDDFSE